MVQIAGLVARRIVCRLRNDDRVQAGQRVGLIRFGSRTDVLVPFASAQPRVVAGTRVKAGTTTIGMWESEDAGVEHRIGTGRRQRV
ncbi:MAG TPA: phosphatidylserine decarboxylase [Herpetosiphonaceae bacterium]|nr:phosphatidylserine decarboxylase [Herpetosiphonaceae bacterium]